MICRVATPWAYKAFVWPFYFGQILQTVLITLESVVKLYGIQAFEDFSWYHATKVAIIIELGASSAYTYI